MGLHDETCGANEHRAHNCPQDDITGGFEGDDDYAVSICKNERIDMKALYQSSGHIWAP